MSPRLQDLLESFISSKRAAEKYYSKDPSVWLAQNKMTQTEVGLRVAAWLLNSGTAAAHVVYTLAGYELTRRENPLFPARRYLTDRLGFTTAIRERDEWRGAYLLPGCPHHLVVDWDRHAGQVITRLASGQRLVVFVSAGLLTSSRSPAEHHKFWQVIGRACTWPHADASDLLAVAVPRSERYRKLASEYRRAEGLARARIAVLTVDRASQVDGLQGVI
jgi:hypothetical protein